MNIKYRSGYAEGGFLDDGASVDPVSGNEVPTGSLAEEVRDDIPAQLSEGEFVVPADVVRFIGLDKLMKMREAAKVGLANMEAEGQMGGQPAPIMEEPMMNDPMMNDPMMDDSLEMDELIDGMDSEGFEGAVQQFADGGSVIPTYKDYTGNEFGSPTTVTFSTYINAAGDKITIPTLRGKPLRPVPEGYSLVVPVSDGGTEEGEPVPVETAPVYTGGTTNNQAAQDFAQNGGREERAKDIVTSNRLHRERIGSLTDLASFDMSQEESDAMFAQLTPQAREIYNSRFKIEAERGLIDGFMSKGKSPADLMIVAQKTADAMNNQRGIIDYDPNASHVPEPGALARGLKYLAMGLTVGATGVIGIALKGMSDEEKETVKSTFESLKGVITQIGEPSPFGNSDGKGNLPNGPTGIPEGGYNQAYWAEKLQKGTLAGNTNIQKDLFLEQQTVAGLTGKDIYGNNISGVNPISSTEIIAKKYRAEQEKLNTIRLMAEEKAAKEAAVKKEAAIEAARFAAAEQARIQKKSDNDARDRAIDAAKQAAAAKVATEEAVRKAAQDRATQQLLKDQNRMQQRSTVNSGPSDNSGGNGNKNDNQGYGGGGGKGGKGKNTARSGYSFGLAEGGMVSKKDSSIMKMRKDPTSGLASKKKAKQKAQAKKGALAAKRT